MTIIRRPDVILDREIFIGMYEIFYQQAVKIDPSTQELTDLDSPYVLISQNEKIFHRY